MSTLKWIPVHSPATPADKGISWYKLTISFLCYTGIDLLIRPPHGKGYIEAIPTKDLRIQPSLIEALVHSRLCKGTAMCCYSCLWCIHYHLINELFGNKQRFFV